jgi:hypothetical protein
VADLALHRAAGSFHCAGVLPTARVTITFGNVFQMTLLLESVLIAAFIFQ